MPSNSDSVAGLVVRLTDRFNVTSKSSYSRLFAPILFTGVIVNIVGLMIVNSQTILPMLKDYYYSASTTSTNIDSNCLYYHTHVFVSIFLWANVLFNLYYAVTTSNSSGPSYEKTVRKLALCSGFTYPDSPEEIRLYQKEYEDRVKKRKNKTTTRGWKINKAGRREWMLLKPFEWGFCYITNQPKPPRSHYDHGIKRLCLCHDHYCPWILNSVGYFNYRYFLTLLLYAMMMSIYLFVVLYEPNQLSSSDKFQQQIKHNMVRHIRDPTDFQMERLYPMVPYPKEVWKIQMAYQTCTVWVVSLPLLIIMHFFFLLSGQTYVEFVSSFEKRVIQALQSTYKGSLWKSEHYDMGSWKRNWEQVFGTKKHSSDNFLFFFVALLPSTREPEFLRIPFPSSKHQGVTQGSKKEKKKKDIDGNDPVVKNKQNNPATGGGEWNQAYYWADVVKESLFAGKC